ncbi:MAG: aldehyde dehydrogenase family protein [Gammaproteobacteria bacterium]
MHKLADSLLSPLLLIDGERQPARDGTTFETFDPSTGEVIGTAPAGNRADINDAVGAAKAALTGSWRNMEPKQRGQCLFAIAEHIRAAADDFGMLECLDAGKSISAATQGAHRAADYFVYYGSMCDKLQGDTIPRGRSRLSFTQLEPVGVTGHITPWNVPLATAARGLAPALACGNSVVIKPAEQTPLSTLLLGQIMLEAGLPAGVCNVVTGFGETAGAALAAHPQVDHLTFTGSVATGKSVMRSAADHVAGVTLELGGKSPIVVLADADLDRATKDILRELHANAGQICSAGTRLVIERSIRDEVRDRLIAGAKSISIGRSLDDPQMGPLISEQQRNRVEGFVNAARQRGLKILTGGARAEVPGCEGGYYYQPTIVDQVPVDDELAQNEVFGPVLCIQPVDSIEEALSVANSTRYGLAAAVYSRDMSNALRLSRDIVAGQVFINEYHSAGDTVPFGGFGESGIGREKGLAALANYSAVKSITARVE